MVYGFDDKTIYMVVEREAETTLVELSAFDACETHIQRFFSA